MSKFETKCSNALERLFAWVGKMSKYPEEDLLPEGWQEVDTSIEDSISS